MKDLYTVSLVFDDKPRYLAFGGDNSVLPKGFRVTTKRELGAKLTKSEAEKLYNQIKSNNLGEKKVRIESVLFNSDI